MKTAFLFSTLLVVSLLSIAQPRRVQLLDGKTGNPISFATIHYMGTGEGEIADKEGRCWIRAVQADSLEVRCLGYATRRIKIAAVGDTLHLNALPPEMEELVVRPPYEKLRWLIQQAIAHKSKHDPDQLEAYSCAIYYKMKIQGYLPDSLAEDSLRKLSDFLENHDLLLSETYTHRAYQKPGRLQETVKASRMAGMKKTAFANLITDQLPFDAYQDFIRLHQKNFYHPLSPGWERRYHYLLADQIQNGEDTLFVLHFWPKPAYRNLGLQGRLILSSQGYALTRIAATTADTSIGLSTSFLQTYQRVQGHWFPKTLQYETTVKSRHALRPLLRLEGMAEVDEISFNLPPGFRFSKAYPVKIDPKVDQRSEEEWSQYRPQPLTDREKKSYAVIDTWMEEQGLENLLYSLGALATRKAWPLGPIDLDLARVWSYNSLEGTRWGLGLYTNDRVSSFISLGGWAAYGIRDQAWKYGGEVRWFPLGHRDHWLKFSYSKDYQNTGQRFLPPALDHRLLSSFLFYEVDRVRSVGVEAQTRRGYFDIHAGFQHQRITPLRVRRFEPSLSRTWTRTEIRAGLRYAFGEVRVPSFGAYLSQETPCPVFYFQGGLGKLQVEDYEVPYGRAMAALTYQTERNRWGKDQWRLEAGAIQTQNQAPLPTSFLLGVNGHRMHQSWQVYAWGGLMTVYPYAYFADRYLSLGYRHDWNPFLYAHRWSRPALAISHQLWWGGAHEHHQKANPETPFPRGPVQETGILVPGLLRLRYLNLIYIQLQVGLLFPWEFPIRGPGPPRLALSLHLE